MKLSVDLGLEEIRVHVNFFGFLLLNTVLAEYDVADVALENTFSHSSVMSRDMSADFLLLPLQLVKRAGWVDRGISQHIAVTVLSALLKMCLSLTILDQLRAVLAVNWVCLQNLLSLRTWIHVKLGRRSTFPRAGSGLLLLVGFSATLADEFKAASGFEEVVNVWALVALDTLEFFISLSSFLSKLSISLHSRFSILVSNGFCGSFGFFGGEGCLPSLPLWRCRGCLLSRGSESLSKGTSSLL